jgi:hypothetical protein
MATRAGDGGVVGPVAVSAHKTPLPARPGRD